MKKNYIFIFLIIIIFVSSGIWYAGKKENKSSSIPPPSSLIAKVTYACTGNKTINAAFYKGKIKPIKPGEPPIPSGSVKIVLSDGRNFDLPQTISADGGRYANNDESFVFWSKGNGAFINEGATTTYKNCSIKN
ncbi:MAG TPA: MliC family protein [Candidatus Paceibacterota bacterium]|jgi:membrane-bound inhibitor of C-type lysozyme|nr:MliC family protein [Candidatus Paceibacterota bacterium]